MGTVKASQASAFIFMFFIFNRKEKIDTFL